MVSSEQHNARNERLYDDLGEVFARHPSVATAYVFGSVARGDDRPDSDLDIGVVHTSRTSDDHAALALRLAHEISRASGFETVDLIDLEAQGPVFCHRVLCEGRRIYEGDRARRIDFESDTIVRALDFRPTYDLAIHDKPAMLRRWLRKRRDDVRPSPDEAGRTER